LASAVSNAGGFGIVETSSGRLHEVREEMASMRGLTHKPWGVNIAQMLVADPHIVDFVAEQGVRFVTTSAGDPARYTEQLHDAGITVFHVVPSLRAAQKAVDAGVDGIVVEGGEGGGFKSTRPVSTMVLLPQICGAFDLPVIAAGGSSTAFPWRQPSRWEPKGFRWARVWSALRSRPCTGITSDWSPRLTQPAPSCSVLIRALHTES
jgi:enoyl-[acyl-carrier protein] reductase II